MPMYFIALALGILQAFTTVTSAIVSLLELHSSDETLKNIFFTLIFEIKPTGLHFSQKLCYSVAETGRFLLLL